VERLSLIVMGIGCGLAAMAGGIMAPAYPISPHGRIPMIMSLLAIVIGGIGSLTGAIMGALILGFSIALSLITCIPIRGSAFSIGYFILLVRPQGLFELSLNDDLF
jgi:branched-chain amino acid transport system permease protein